MKRTSIPPCFACATKPSWRLTQPAPSGTGFVAVFDKTAFVASTDTTAFVTSVWAKRFAVQSSAA